MITKAELKEKIKELENINLDLQENNKKLIKENEELKNITNDQKKEEFKDTIKYHDKLIKKLIEKVEKLENERKLILGRKPFEDNKIIELMYKLYLENNSFNEIANQLNKKNICTRRGGSWSKSSVSLILKKEENIKKYLNSKEKYNKFIELLESNKRNKKQ